ncbi:CHRD domain-containing protein [Candidatus Roizmanbacteria bacterium]|nr:CHRD domain-containing protein [Candidatus Roizmanbacteria bacterium]
MKDTYSNSIFTPKNIAMYLVIGGIIYIGVYFLFMKKGETPLYQQPTSSVQESVETIGTTAMVVLEAQNDSGESGLATLTEVDGKTQVVLQMENSPVDTAQPAHIHIGSCPMPGAVSYPLTNVVNGTSETLLEVDLATLRQQLPLAINVHKSGAEAKIYVACGDLE